MSGTWLAAAGGWLALYELAARYRGAGRQAFPRDAGRWLWYGAGLLLAVVGEPPLSALAHRSLWAQTAQFGLLAFGVVPLAVSGWPDATRPAGQRPLRSDTAGTRVIAGIAALACFLAVTIGWRVPPAVAAAASGRGWLAVEALTLLAGGWWLWSVLTGRSAALPRPGRIALAAVATWSVWVFAYVLGFSAHPFYPAFAAGGAPVGAQEIAVGVLFGTSALAFCPLMFVNLTRWLTADEAAAEAEMSRHPDRFRAVEEPTRD
jgi:hypothetical protein